MLSVFRNLCVLDWQGVSDGGKEIEGEGERGREGRVRIEGEAL